MIDLEKERLQKELRERTYGYISAAFGLVAGLAWNDAIRALIEYIFPLSQNTLFAKFAYAILITVLVVIATSYFLKTSENKSA